MLVRGSRLVLDGERSVALRQPAILYLFLAIACGTAAGGFEHRTATAASSGSTESGDQAAAPANGSPQRTQEAGPPAVEDTPPPRASFLERTLQFLESEGPQGPSCKEALGLIDEPPQAPPGPVNSVRPTPPDPSGMPVLVVNDAKTAVEALPGSQLDALEPQLIEGTPEVLARIGDVIREGESGGRVRLSFFGASHTGGDMWTGEIRRRLQDRWGDLGHGFILPAALYRGYRGRDINLCRTDGWLSDWAGKANGHGDGLLGFAGMSVSSKNPRDFGWVETTRQNPHGRKVQWFDLYTLGQPGGGSLSITVDGSAPQALTTKSDSIQLQRTRIEVNDGSHRLVLAPAGDGEARVFGVSLERAGGGALVDAMGIRGRQANTWLGWDTSLFQAGLSSLDPDLVVLAYGTNEAADQSYTMEAYRKDLHQVLERLRAALPARTPCILAGPSDRGIKLGGNAFAVWDRTAAVTEVQRELAPLYGCGFWDWQAATGGPGSMVAWRFHKPQLAAGDLIHFTRRGYEWLGQRFVDQLLELGKERPTSSPVENP
ncbi:MAG: hypothetical protein CL928_12080 [Deltaproteobacteria bacterium]|nr:hypothetical protein [Deltaproteobacteria bacterium]